MDCKLACQIIIGTTSSITAAILTLWGQRIIQCYSDRKKYSKAQGKYLGYAVKNSDFRTMDEKPQSEATICYEGENRLTIKLTHDNGQRIWEGLIVLENEHNGTIGWRYTNMAPNQVEFGFKRCIIEPDGYRVLLIDDSPPMYGKEILIRKA